MERPETTLDVGRSSAQALGNGSNAWISTPPVLASKQARGASAYEIIRIRYNDARPLIELGRLTDAERILLETQQAYEDQDDIARLQQVLGTRAFLENRRGRPQQHWNSNELQSASPTSSPSPVTSPSATTSSPLTCRGPDRIRQRHAPTGSPPPSSSSSAA